MARHILERYKNRGFCRELRGCVHIRSVFVDEPDFCWAKDERLSHRAALIEVSRFLRKEAAKLGVPLSFTFTEEHIRSDRHWAVNDMKRFGANYARKHGCQSLAVCAARLRAAQNVNQAALIFLFRKPARSFAPFFNTADTIEYSEAVFMYGTDHLTHKNYLLHELLHVCGAADLYYPEAVKSAADRYYPHSVMRNVDSDALGELDNLTKYLIGWFNVPPRDAALFLKETAMLTDADLDAAIAKTWATQPNAVIRFKNGTYYGPVCDGMIHGKGRFVFSNGDVYEGEFSNGAINGRGTVTKKNGRQISGVFENGVLRRKK